MGIRVQTTIKPETPQVPANTPSTGEVHEATVQEPAESVGSPASQQPSSSATSDQTGGIPVGQDESVPVEVYEAQQPQSEKQTQEQNKKDNDSSAGISPQPATTSKSTPEEEAKNIDVQATIPTDAQIAVEQYRAGKYRDKARSIEEDEEILSREDDKELKEKMVDHPFRGQDALNDIADTEARQNRGQSQGYIEAYQKAINEQADIAANAYALHYGMDFYELDEAHKIWWCTVIDIASFLTRADYDILSHDKARDGIRVIIAIKQTRMFFGMDKDDATGDKYIYEMAALQLGFAPDTHQNLFNRPQGDSGITAQGFIRALRQIRDNVNNPTLICPFSLDPSIVMGGTTCIPIPIMPEPLLKWMTAQRPGNRFAATDLERIRQACEQEWNGVHEEGRNIIGIHDWMMQNCPVEQQIAVEAMVEAVELINGTNNEYSGHHFDASLTGMFNLASS